MTLILALDPGATRCGWAITQVVDVSRRYIESGTVACPRGAKEDYQVYRERLVRHWAEEAFPSLADRIEDLRQELQDREFEVVFEIVPAIGFSSGGAVQSQLAQAVATVCQALCADWEWPWRQVSASTVKKSMTGYGDATKVQIRDAVISLFPELEPRKKELTSTADESDAIAISAVAGGYKVPKVKGSNPRRKRKKAKVRP